MSEVIESMVAAAQPGPSGVFSLDLTRVEVVFQAGGDDWLHYWLRFAAFYGAEPAEIDWDGSRFELRFRSPGPDLEGLRGLLLHRERGPRYLGLGMLAAAQEGFGEISLEAPRGTVGLKGLEENRRSRDGFCRVRARAPRRSRLPQLENLVLPVFLNGAPVPRSPAIGGVRLIVDGFAFAWNEVPVLPPGESLDWTPAEVRLDARLRRLVHPVLTREEILRLQAEFEAVLRQRAELSLEAGEWLMLRASDEEMPHWLQRLPAPPPEHSLAPAFHERRRRWLTEPLPPKCWDGWPRDAWPRLLELGLAPFPLPDWLRPTFARLPGPAAYGHLLRTSWLGPHFDPAFLEVLLRGRRDTLGGNVLLAMQLGLGKARPQPATDFCREFLEAVAQGQEAPGEWNLLSALEQQQVVALLEGL